MAAFNPILPELFEGGAGLGGGGGSEVSAAVYI